MLDSITPATGNPIDTRTFSLWCFTARRTTTATGCKSESSTPRLQRRWRLHDHTRRPSAELSGFRRDAQEKQKHHKHGQEHLVHSFLPPQITMMLFYQDGSQQSRANCRWFRREQENLRGTPLSDTETRVFGTLRGDFLSEFRLPRGRMSRHMRRFNSLSPCRGILGGIRWGPAVCWGKPDVVQENDAGSCAVEAEPDLPQFPGVKVGIDVDEIGQRDLVGLEHGLHGRLVAAAFPISPLRECHVEGRLKRRHMTERQPCDASVGCDQLDCQVDVTPVERAVWVRAGRGAALGSFFSGVAGRHGSPANRGSQWSSVSARQKERSEVVIQLPIRRQSVGQGDREVRGVAAG